MDIETRRIRNIGISAHIDAGKTTLTERILYYTKRIHRMHEVRGKDGVGATMDSMDLERERGITIQSAATYCQWKGAHLNIIDTPGHVDFTIEVERALRVLDGGILVLCAVSGVQSQTITVSRQMDRHQVARIAFVNKCDRTGADPLAVVEAMRTKLGLPAVAVQLPVGTGESFRGVVDLVHMEELSFEGDDGSQVVRKPIPPALLEEAQAGRQQLVEEASMLDDELLELALADEEIPSELLVRAIRTGVRTRRLVPVLMGSAYRNKGVQPLLDAVVDYLPSPTDIEIPYETPDGDEGVADPRPDAPTLAYAFKLEDGPYGQLTYLRIYQGKIEKGQVLTNQSTGKKLRVGRIGRMHADSLEEISAAGPGDIVALFGAECRSGDTLTADGLRARLGGMHIPEPVVRLSVRPATHQDRLGLARALERFTKEDPTFRSETDPETGETVIAGMGELHLEVYLERMRREYGVSLLVGPPQVAYRETVTRRANFDYLHKKQTGGAGQYGRIIGYIEPAEEPVDLEFLDEVRGGNVPSEYVPFVEKGFRIALAKGPLTGFPVVGVRVVLQDGRAHSVDSSGLAFQTAAQGAFKQAYPKAFPKILEPLVKVVVESPKEYFGAVLQSLASRRGQILGSTDEMHFVLVEAEVPLAEMFGYASELRSATQGKASFSMEFTRYAPVPDHLADEIRRQRQAAGRAAAH